MTEVDFPYIVDFIKKKRQFFTMICAGPTDSGKTVFVKCLTKELLSNYMLTVVFSGSSDEYEYYSGDDNNPIVPPRFHLPFNLDLIGAFMGALERIKKARGKIIPCLIIFDDFSGEVNIHNNPLFRKLITRSKHLKCAIFINVHFLAQVDPTIRSNVNYIVAFLQDYKSIEYLATTVIGYSSKSLLSEYTSKMRALPRYSALFIQRLEPYMVKQVLYMLPIGQKKSNNVFETDEINDNPQSDDPDSDDLSNDPE